MDQMKAMKLALTTLIGWVNVDNWVWPETAKEQAKRNTDEAITALRQAIQEAALQNITDFDQQAEHEPLSDEEIDRVTDAQWASNNHKPIYAAHRAYARAIEAAHGIKGEA